MDVSALFIDVNKNHCCYLNVKITSSAKELQPLKVLSEVTYVQYCIYVSCTQYSNRRGRRAANTVQCTVVQKALFFGLRKIFFYIQVFLRRELQSKLDNAMRVLKF